MVFRPFLLMLVCGIALFLAMSFRISELEQRVMLVKVEKLFTLSWEIDSYVAFLPGCFGNSN